MWQRQSTAKCRTRPALYLIVLVFGITVVWAPLASAQTFTFTKIAEDIGSAEGLEFARPVINDDGVVAFFTCLQLCEENAIRRGDGGALTTLAETGGLMPQDLAGLMQDIWINNSGLVVLRAGFNNGIFGLYTANGGPLTKVVDSTDGVANAFSNWRINDGGTVAYSSFLASSPGSPWSIRINGGQVIYDDSGMFAEVGGFDFNNDGTFAFWGRTDSDDQGLYLGNGGAATQVSELSPSEISLNNLGRIAFRVSSNIYLTTDGTPAFVSLGVSGDPSVNDLGHVAFWGWSRTGVYLWNGIEAVPVLEEGDALFGSTVDFLDFFQGGLNNLGQMAILAKLTNGDTVIARAEPSGLPIFTDGFESGDISSWTLSQGTNEP